MVVIYYRTKEAIARNPSAGLNPWYIEGLNKDDYEFVHCMDDAPSFEEIFRMMNVVDGDELPVKLACAP